MKRLVIFGAALALAVPMSFAVADSANAGSKSKKYYKVKKTYSVKSGWFANWGKSKRPQVKGFSASVGGYSFSVGQTYAYDPLSPRPNDWPRHDDGPSQHGIIPTSPYP